MPAYAAPPHANNDTYTTLRGTALVTTASNGVLANDTDSDNDHLTAALTNAPTHGTLQLSSDGSFRYTPNGDFTGTDTFNYRAHDASSQSNNATVTITVTAANVAPVAVNDSYGTAEDTALTVTAGSGVLHNDTDANGNSLTAALVGNVSHGTLTLNANGSFTYTPAGNYAGSDSFTYRASDGSLNSNTATVTITVTAVNDPPVAVNDSYSTPKGTPLNVPAKGVLANDTDPDSSSLTAVVASNPTHGTLALNANGSFTYTPTAGYTGPDAFTYRANDGSLNSNTATVAITVTTVNSPPVAANDTYSTPKGTPLSVNAASGVLANDTDPDGNALTAVLASNPAHGTVVLSSNGSFTYAPAVGFTGADSFT
jgi:VCBS repeat-containing protein